MADHFPAPRVRKAIEVALIEHSDEVVGEEERALPRRAKTDAVQTFARLQSVPGSGQILA